MPYEQASPLLPDSASREELQQRLAAKVAALREARHAEERKKQTEAAKRFRATNGHVEKKVGMPVLCASILQFLVRQAKYAAVMAVSEELLISCDAASRNAVAVHSISVGLPGRRQAEAGAADGGRQGRRQPKDATPVSSRLPEVRAATGCHGCTTHCTVLTAPTPHQGHHCYRS